MKKLIACCLLFVVFFVCSCGQYTHKAARKAAEEFYTMLIEGNYQGFVDGYANAESLPEGYRSQLVDAVAQLMATERMRNLTGVVATKDSLLEDSAAYVMLQLNYCDSTSEQVELPLILMEDGWRMK